MRSLVLVLGAGIFAIVPGLCPGCGFGREDFRPMQGVSPDWGERKERQLARCSTGCSGERPGRLKATAIPPRTRIPESPGMKQLSANTSRIRRAKIPGTKMTFPGLKDPKQIDDIVAYLKQFDSTGKKKAEIVPAGRKLAKVQ